VTKKRKIILISLAVTLALSVGVGGLVYAKIDGHEDTGGNKLLGVGEMGYAYYEWEFDGYGNQYQWWDTQFIITNPNCERELTIEWVALIDSDEYVIFEGTPEDWYWCYFMSVEIPEVLSGHKTFQVSIAELIAAYDDEDPEYVMDDYNLDKYTLEVTWSGAHYSGWWWWGYWRSGRPLTGWQKEKCLYNSGVAGERHGGYTISEAEMKLFHSRRPFEPPDWWDPGYCMME